MKKFLTYIAISFYLLGTTEASELLKLGNLIGHYIEHKNSNNLGFLAFINIHYLEATVIDADFAEDQKLPFKSHNDCKLQLTEADRIHTDYCIELQSVELNTPITQYKSPLLSNKYLNEIFQPPRG